MSVDKTILHIVYERMLWLGRSPEACFRLLGCVCAACPSGSALLRHALFADKVTGVLWSNAFPVAACVEWKAHNMIER